MNTITRIQISRCEIVYGDKTVAIVHLNNYNHIIGQPVMVRYNTADGGTDTITAIGLRNGQGPDCYSIISMGEERYIGGVLQELPDVSSLVHNISYVAKFNGVWSLFYIDDTESVRQISELQSGDKFYSLADDHKYFYRDGNLFRDDDAASVLEDRLTMLDAGDILFSVDYDSSRVIKTGQSFSRPLLDIEVLTQRGDDITSLCDFNVMAGDREVSSDILGGKLRILENITETTEYKITASYQVGNTVPKTKTCAIKFTVTDPVLYGAVGKTEYEALWDGESSLTLIFNLVRDKSYIKVPVGLGIFDHIYDENSLDYIHEYTIAEDSGYIVYEKKSPVTIDNFKQVFSYAAMTCERGSINYDDLISTEEFNQIFTR